MTTPACGGLAFSLSRATDATRDVFTRHRRVDAPFADGVREVCKTGPPRMGGYGRMRPHAARAPGGNDMSIDLWHVVLAVALAGGSVAIGTRWWFGRQLAALRSERDRLDANQQSTLRMVSQARKQIDDLQRMVTESRRKISTLELERRRATAKLSAIEALEEPAAPGSGRMPAGWADTQPM
jgi:uncharacterized protein HemX